MGEVIRVAVVSEQSGLVENIAVIQDGDGSSPVKGFLLIPSEDAAIGDTWDGIQIVKPPQPIVETREQETLSVAMVGSASDRPTLNSDLDALAARVAAIEAKLGL
jgi:hypothetical protein